MIGWTTIESSRWLAIAAVLLLVHCAATTAPAAGPPDIANRPQYSATGPVQAPQAQPDAPVYGGDGTVQQTTYQSAGDFRSRPGSDSVANPTARNPAEPMPLDPAGRNVAGGAASNARRASPPTPSSLPAILTMFGSLAVVLGLFLGMTWLLRRGLPKGTRLLSSEVVEVLGRTPLAPRQQMHVIRFGSRLLLVSVTSTGAETLAEITDPAEVDRLAGICQQSHAHSATNTFRQIFRQLSEGRGNREIASASSERRIASGARSSRSAAAENNDG